MFKWLTERATWHGVRVHFLAVIILAPIGAVWALLEGWWPGILRDIWAVVSYSVPIPISILVALIVVLWLVRKVLPAVRRLPFKPDTLQTEILKLLAARYPKPIYPDELQHQWKISRLHIDEALAGLVGVDLIWRSGGAYGGAFNLTPDGRRFVVDAGYVSNMPQA